MKERNQINSKIKDFNTKNIIAAKIRDYSLSAEAVKGKTYKNIEYSIEVFNNLNYRYAPDSIGITIFYPNKISVTHYMTKIFPIEITEKEFGKSIKEMYKTLMQKVRGN